MAFATADRFESVTRMRARPRAQRNMARGAGRILGLATDFPMPSPPAREYDRALSAEYKLDVVRRVLYCVINEINESGPGEEEREGGEAR